MGWIGSLLIITGAYLLGHKRRIAFIFTMTGGVCWSIQGLMLNRMDIIFIESFMFCIAMRNYIKWGKVPH